MSTLWALWMFVGTAVLVVLAAAVLMEDRNGRDG